MAFREGQRVLVRVPEGQLEPAAITSVNDERVHVRFETYSYWGGDESGQRYSDDWVTETDIVEVLGEAREYHSRILFSRPVSSRIASGQGYPYTIFAHHGGSEWHIRSAIPVRASLAPFIEGMAEYASAVWDEEHPLDERPTWWDEV